MKKLAILSLTIIVLASLPIMQTIPRHVNPSELSEEYPEIIGLLSVYASIMDKALLEDFGGSLRNLNESMKIHVPRDVKYIYDRFNELLRDELDRLNYTKRCIDVARLNMVLGLLEYAGGNLSQATYSLAQANLTYTELKQSVEEFERMLRIPRNQLAVKLTSIEKLLAKYLNEVRELRDKLKSLREAGLEETEVSIWVDRASVWVGESVKLSGFLRSSRGYPLEDRAVSVYLDGGRVDMPATDERGFFSTKLSMSGVYKSSVQVYAEYNPSSEDVGRYRASRSNVITIHVLYDKPTIYAELSHRKARPGQAVNVYGWVNASLGRLPEKIYMDAFSTTLSKSLNSSGFFDFIFKVPEDVEEGSYKVRLYTQASGIIAPSEKVLPILIEKIPVNVTYLASTIALSGGEVVVTGRVTASASSSITLIPYSKITIIGFGNQSIVYSDEGGGFTASIHVPLSTMTGHSKISLFIEPPSQQYKTHSLSIEVFIVNPLIMLAPSILFVVALVYAAPLVREVRESIAGRKPTEVLEEAYILEAPRTRFFYLEAALMVGDVTGLHIKDYETIREYLARVGGLLGEAYQIFKEISILAERELYGQEQANRMVVKELLRKLKESLQK